MAFFVAIPSDRSMDNAIAQMRSMMKLVLHRGMFGADPVQVVGNNIIVHLDPSYNRDALIDHFVENGISIGTNDIMHDIVHGVQPLQVTRLYPWNHPADDPERVWPLSDLFDTGYYDKEGKPFPPPPKLVRTSNCHEWSNDGEYFDKDGNPFPAPAILSRTTNELSISADLDFSVNAPFSPRSPQKS